VKKLSRLIRKIEQIENLLAEIKLELKELENENKKKVSINTPSKKEKYPSDKELKEEYNTLYQFYVSGNIDKVYEFIKSKNKEHLKYFCKANNLPIDIKKVSKDEISKEIVRWMAQRKAISEEVKPAKK